MKKTGERAHSKYSASGAERWFHCPGSVALSEGLPDKNTPWSIEGTLAHAVLESLLKDGIELTGKDVTKEIIRHGRNTARFILDLGKRLKAAVLVETRVHLDFIHPEMFGTYDGAVLDHFDTLHIFDYKFGKTAVSPKKNLQMIFYAIGVAYKYNWNFKRARLWIVQPRVRGYDGPVFWDISIEDLRKYVPVFTKAVERVEKNPKLYIDGDHCHWCKAKTICPIKRSEKLEKAQAAFGAIPIEGEN